MVICSSNPWKQGVAFVRFAALLLVVIAQMLAAQETQIVMWGNISPQIKEIPAEANFGVTAVGAGDNWVIALKSTGKVIAWGELGNFPTLVTAMQSNVVAISAGLWHALALKGDGSVAAGGIDPQENAKVPAAAGAGIVAVSAGFYHSVALNSSGSTIAWGDNSFNQTDGSQMNGIAAIAAGGYHTLALDQNGGVHAWGRSEQGQTTVPTAAQSGVTAIAAGEFHSMALKANGSVVVWGDQNNGQGNIPAAALSGVIAIASGTYTCFALKGDGTIVAWGSNNAGELNVPSVKVTSIERGGNGSGGNATSICLALRKTVISGTKSWDPPCIRKKKSTTTTITVPGALLGRPVVVGLTTVNNHRYDLTGTITKPNTVTVKLVNRTGKSKNLGTGTLTATVFNY